MDVYFSTVVRGAQIQQAGELNRLNWETKCIEACAPIFPSDPEVDDPNPRGNTRGGRGIALVGEEVMCVSWHSLLFFDRQTLRPTRRFTHPLLVDLHEVILEDDGTLYISVTALDAVFQIDMVTGRIIREYWPREDPRIQEMLGVEPLVFNRTADNRIEFVTTEYKKEPGHLHINTATRFNGETYILANSLGAIINLDRGEIVVRHDALKGSHNLVFRGDCIYNSDSLGKKVNVFSRITGEMVQQIDLLASAKIRKIHDASQASGWQHLFRSVKNTTLNWLKHTPVRKLYYKAKMDKIVPALPLFVRGLDVVDGQVFCGFSPATVAQFDAESGRLVDLFQYTKDVATTVHGLKIAS